MPRYYIKFLGGAAKVDDLVGLSPSNHGTTNPLVLEGAALGCTACAEQEAVGSSFLNKLNRGDETPAPVDYTVVQTRYDAVVVPYTSAFLQRPRLAGHERHAAGPLPWRLRRPPDDPDGPRRARVGGERARAPGAGRRPLQPDVLTRSDQPLAQRLSGAGPVADDEAHRDPRAADAREPPAPGGREPQRDAAGLARAQPHGLLAQERAARAVLAARRAAARAAQRERCEPAVRGWARPGAGDASCREPRATRGRGGWRRRARRLGLRSGRRRRARRVRLVRRGRRGGEAAQAGELRRRPVGPRGEQEGNADREVPADPDARDATRRRRQVGERRRLVREGVEDLVRVGRQDAGVRLESGCLERGQRGARLDRGEPGEAVVRAAEQPAAGRPRVATTPPVAAPAGSNTRRWRPSGAAPGVRVQAGQGEALQHRAADHERLPSVHVHVRERVAERDAEVERRRPDPVEVRREAQHGRVAAEEPGDEQVPVVARARAR